MRVRLKDINRVTKRLADGTPRTYYYAWKGGPPLRGEPGTPGFIASYNEAVASKKTPPRGRLLSVLQAFQDSEDFRDGIAPRTRADYIGKIKLIEKAFGDFPLSAMTDARTRNLQGMARTTGRRFPTAGGLCVGRAGAGALLGHGSRPCACQSLRTGWQALSWLACGEHLDPCRRGRVFGTCSRAPAPAAATRVVDWSKAR
jgi:hypothetical protein